MDPALFAARCCRADDDLQESFDTLLMQRHEGGEKFDQDRLITELRTYLRKKFRFHISEWEPDRETYPRYIFLNGDKGILAYVRFRYLAGDGFREEDLEMPLDDTIRLVRYAQSRLDRPVFFISLLNYVDRMGLYFETDEQIKDRLYNDEDCVDRERGVYRPDIRQMGRFSELQRIWTELRLHNVRWS